jgi:rhodanese-related sulfurtransferase
MIIEKIIKKHYVKHWILRGFIVKWKKLNNISRMNKNYIILLILFVIISLVLFHAYRYAIDSPYRISAEKAKRKILKSEFDIILDVRTKMERDTLGYYPNSIHIPSNELESKIEKVIPIKSTRILIYCNTGQRARLATEKLKRLGYSNVVYISGSHVSIM